MLWLHFSFPLQLDMAMWLALANETLVYHFRENPSEPVHNCIFATTICNGLEGCSVSLSSGVRITLRSLQLILGKQLVWTRRVFLLFRLIGVWKLFVTAAWSRLSWQIQHIGKQHQAPCYYWDIPRWLKDTGQEQGAINKTATKAVM